MTDVRRIAPIALSAALVVLAVTLLVPLLGGHGSTVAQPRIPLLVFAGLWLAFELVVLYLAFGRDLDHAETLTLTEVPLALGLLFVTPADLLLVGVGVPVVVDLVRRRPAIKQVFNGSTHLAEVALALALYRALEPTAPLSLQGWGAVLLVVMVTSVTTAAAVATVISLVIGRVPRRDFVLHVLLAVPVSVVAATLAVLAGLALQRGAWTVAPLVAALASLLLLLWGISTLTERHLNLASLHDFGQRITGSRDMDTIACSALETSLDVLLARRAEAYYPAPDGAPRTRHVRHEAGAGTSQAWVAPTDVPAARDLRGNRRALVVASPLAPGQELVLAVSGRAGPMPAFGRAEERALDMVAQLTAPALRTAQLIDQLRREALHDPLTGLPNRRSLVASLQDRISRDTTGTVVWLGVQDLAVVNAALGHQHGDQLLVQLGRRLQEVSGRDVVVARVGGNGFAVLLDGPDGASGAGPQDLMAGLRAPVTLSGVPVLVRASAGVAVWGDPGDTAGEVLRRADIAMRHSRRTGRGLERYTPALETATPDRLLLVSELQAGIDRDELLLYAQPQVRLTDGVVTGVEALVRWRHPRRGLLGPDAFIPLAEQTGLDRPLTSWVLDAGLGQVARWRDAGLPLTVSVNVPPSALADGELPELIAELLAAHDVPGQRLVVEITERGFLTNTAVAVEMLHRLAALGVRISIDDFGTGFSSLAHLRRLPLDEVKIDRSFVRTMLQDDDDAAIVRSVADLSRDLGLACVAEGVEDEAVYSALQRLGCDLAQGYYLARPMPLAEVGPWLQARGNGR